MASITIKDIPQVLLERLRKRAAKDRRSMNKEAVHLLDLALPGTITEDEPIALARRVESQVEAWRRLAGRWDSDRNANHEIQEIYTGRTRGRSVEP